MRFKIVKTGNNRRSRSNKTISQFIIGRRLKSLTRITTYLILITIILGAISLSINDRPIKPLKQKLTSLYLKTARKKTHTDIIISGTKYTDQGKIITIVTKILKKHHKNKDVSDKSSSLASFGAPAASSFNTPSNNTPSSPNASQQSGQEGRDTPPILMEIQNSLKSQLHWIKEIRTKRILPNKLIIEITEYRPFALWQNNSATQIIDETGQIIKEDDILAFADLIIITGDNILDNVGSLFNILSINPQISSKIHSASWVSNRRWNIQFENGPLIMLPENNLAAAWQKLIDFYSIEGSFIGLNRVDLRLKEKMFLQYNNNQTREIGRL